MRRPTRILLHGLAAAALVAPAAAARWESIESLPGHAAVTVTVKGKPRVYFRITPKAPLRVAMAGPAQLRIISRAVLPGGGARSAAYQVLATGGGKALVASHDTAGVAEDVSAPGAAAVAESRRLLIDVPDGTHVVEIQVAGAAAVLARLQRSAPEVSESWVSLTPVRAARSVSVVEGEKAIAYYTTMRDKPVALRVVGPTTLDLLARLDFDDTMRGQQAYRLRLLEKGRTLREVEFRTTKALTASYSNVADRVPSKFDRLTLTVDAGLHEIEIHLVAPAAGAAEIHARIPQPSVGNTE